MADQGSVNRAAYLLTGILLLAACDQPGSVTPDAVNPDTRMDAVLLEPIMIDPDLSQMDRRNAVLEPGGPADPSLPGPYEPKKPSRP